MSVFLWLEREETHPILWDCADRPGVAAAVQDSFEGRDTGPVFTGNQASNKGSAPSAISSHFNF